MNSIFGTTLDMFLFFLKFIFVILFNGIKFKILQAAFLSSSSYGCNLYNKTHQSFKLAYGLLGHYNQQFIFEMSV